MSKVTWMMCQIVRCYENDSQVVKNREPSAGTLDVEDSWMTMIFTA